jgi:hypothetical protein
MNHERFVSKRVKYKNVYNDYLVAFITVLFDDVTVALHTLLSPFFCSPSVPTLNCMSTIMYVKTVPTIPRYADLFRLKYDRGHSGSWRRSDSRRQPYFCFGVIALKRRNICFGYINIQYIYTKINDLTHFTFTVFSST